MELGITISKKSLEKIIEFEVSSKAYYEKRLMRPMWPGGSSGITIGIGYDLAHHTPSQIRIDWFNNASPNEIEKLCSVSGLKGIAAKNALSKVSSVSISYNEAVNVFFKKSIIKFAKVLKKTYPNIALLEPDAQGALLSLVYNRGGLIDNSSRRREMKKIRDLIGITDYNGIAAELRSMKRLWNPTTAKGLINRREYEAKLVENAIHDYYEDEIIKI